MAVDAAGWTTAQQIETSLGPVTYRDVGQGPVLVFLHLVLAAGDQWRGIVERLSDRYRCIVPDLTLGGHRVPAAPDADLSPPGLARGVADFLEALDLEEVTLIGNDTGGAIAQLVAADHPERLGRLVLTNCDAYDNFPPRIFWYLKALGYLPGGVWLLGQTLRLRALWRLPIAYGWLCHDIDVVAASSWGDALRSSRAVRRDAAKALRGMHRRHTLAAAEKLRGFEHPVLVAWGAEDRAFPIRHGERLVADLPNAQLEPIEGARTFVMWDRPDVLAELITTFVPSSSHDQND